ncbi:MAG: hypothetical protein IIA88_11080, partial [Bacteroidetes bacterium]|nr:hypothetical protein [Bacteroidota bacterium]
IHFAKVGGMKKDDLPKEDQKSFEEWFVDLPQNKQKQFESPAMKNVLNMHANELYETLHNEVEQFKDEKMDTEQFKEQVQFVIKKAFQCLTKIDDSKAVRNRTTLEEMVEIIGVKGWDTKRIDKLLNIFRQQGNTLIYPFINEDPASENLVPGTLLDITHEALIRNWQRLGEWTKEEHESVLDYRELSSQLQRWIDNDRSKGHLLASGPFQYFRKWLKIHKPTPAWIKRYLVNPIYQTDGIAIKPLVDTVDKEKMEE